MKYATVALAFAVAVAAQEPAILNTDFDIKENVPYIIKFSGCETSCTINLKAGPSGDLDTIQPLTTSATGGSATITLTNLPTDSYAFEIIDNTTHEKNYSQQFEFDGTGEKPTTAKTTEAVSSTTEAPSTTEESTTTTTTSEEKTTETSTSEETTTTAESSATTLTTVRSSSASATESATSTESEESTTAEATTAPTTVPDGGAGSLASPMSLVMGAVAALLLLH